MGLLCQPFYVHGAIGSSYFAGWAIFAIYLPNRANKKGRKSVVVLTFFVTTIALAVTLINQSLTFHIVLIFVLGLFASGRIAVAFIYMMELLTPEWASFVATISSILYVVFFAFITAYIRFFSKDYLLITYIGVAFGTTSLVGIWYFIDESALYLLRTG